MTCSGINGDDFSVTVSSLVTSVLSLVTSVSSLVSVRVRVRDWCLSVSVFVFGVCPCLHRSWCLSVSAPVLASVRVRAVVGLTVSVPVGVVWQCPDLRNLRN